MRSLIQLTVFLGFFAMALRADATMVVYYSDELLFDTADIVVQGVTWRRSKVDNAFPAREYEIEAVECFKGCKPGDYLVMYGPGEGIVGAPDVPVGSRVILYLKKTQAGTREVLAPISLGMSVYKLEYNAVLKRFFAQRQIDNLSALLPAVAGRDEGNKEVQLARDRLAAEFVDEIRALAGKRGTR
jgi:hypothetical protein